MERKPNRHWVKRKEEMGIADKVGGGRANKIWFQGVYGDIRKCNLRV